MAGPEPGLTYRPKCSSEVGTAGMGKHGFASAAVELYVSPHRFSPKESEKGGVGGTTHAHR